MDKEKRRAAMANYRLVQPPAGIYTLRFTDSDMVWVGAARDLTKIENRHRFELRIGSHRCSPLQQAWLAFGEDKFAFNPIETLDPDTPEISRERILKERRTHWAAELGATLI